MCARVAWDNVCASLWCCSDSMRVKGTCVCVCARVAWDNVCASLWCCSDSMRVKGTCVCVCVCACVRAHASVPSVGYYVCVSLWCHPDMLVGEGDVCGVCVLAWGSTCACPSGAVQK